MPGHQLAPDMVGVFVSSLFQVLEWPRLGFMLLGVLVGFWVGILPGIGGGTAMALMLPFVFGMDPLSAIAFLLGMHAVVTTTGDVTSILFAVPGEGSAAATIVDGFPLARQGEAGRALGIALFSSLLGAIVGALALLIAVPFVRPLVLSFGPPELFMLGVLGMSYIAALSGRSVARGGLMACAGLLLATVGHDPGTGRLRYTFGEPYLFDGISLLPVTIGLFAVPAIVAMMAERGSTARAPVPVHGAFQGVKDTCRHWWLVVRSSAIGVWFGVLPGVGGGTAQWVAYAHARQTSREKARFGHGSIEGLIAATAVNNSKEGGSILPTIAFGVPGGASMALLLGAFVITGLTPGPPMLTTHLDVTFGMVWTIVLANVVVVAVCFAFLKHLAGIAMVKGTLLAPFLVVLVGLGAYTATNSWLDLVALLAFGAIGLAAQRWGWPAPPLVIGLVLGDIMERNYFLSYSLFGFAWLARPLVLVLLLATVAGLLWPLLGSRSRREAPDQVSWRTVEADAAAR